MEILTSQCLAGYPWASGLVGLSVREREVTSVNSWKILPAAH